MHPNDLLGELEDFRFEVRTDHDDVVLDVMDFVDGWCSPHMRVPAEPPA